jgi:hypothetical protein
MTNAVTKTIYSTAHNVGVLRFVDAGTKALELENGSALNEPTTYAVRVAIEQAVYELITEGQRKVYGVTNVLRRNEMMSSLLQQMRRLQQAAQRQKQKPQKPPHPRQ